MEEESILEPLDTTQEDAEDVVGAMSGDEEDFTAIQNGGEFIKN
jgi:hypothetical protein